MGKLTTHLMPTDREILDLALRETDPREVERFEPVCRGPLFALIAIPAIVALAIPSCLLRLLRGWQGRVAGDA